MNAEGDSTGVSAERRRRSTGMTAERRRRFAWCATPTRNQIRRELAYERQRAAEREGFEPSVDLLDLRTLSKRLPSATRSPLQGPLRDRFAARSDAELCNDCGSTVNVMKKLSMQTLWRSLGQFALSVGLIATACAALLATPSPSFACKCAPPPEVVEALAQATAVFEAQVSQLNATADELEVTLRVTRAWKGVDTETIRVRTRKDSAASGIDIAMGQVWLVYANQTTEPDATIALQVLRCGRSRLAEEADDDFTVLGLGVVPVAPREPAPPIALDAGPTAAQPNQPQPVSPAANGCASCSIGTAPHSSPIYALLLVGGTALARSRRRKAARRSAS
jgi:MYXO-CTERM domain-containing protein